MVGGAMLRLQDLMRAAKKRTAEGTVIRRLRIKAGITQENLARQVGVTTHTIWMLENHPSANPRLKTLRAIAKSLGVPVSKLVS